MAEKHSKNEAGAPNAEGKRPALGGKRLADVHEAKNDATAKAGDVARNSALAGIAVIWLLTKEGVDPISGPLLFSLLFLAAGLVADFSQYVYCSRLWSEFYAQEYQKHGSDDALVDIPDDLTSRTYLFFWLKIVLFSAGFLLLLWGGFCKINIG
jgi:hypothetical protein